MCNSPFRRKKSVFHNVYEPRVKSVRVSATSLNLYYFTPAWKCFTTKDQVNVMMLSRI